MQKSLVSYQVKNFGSFGKYLKPENSITINISYINYLKHKKYYKYIEVDYNKLVTESNYKNNIKNSKYK
ncbi:hypothetical protein [Methanobrevibacter cuticularis]|uniref:hypothetical protein n=1 Tax=Methanobrevibacter cuticularis TaxID=47311 RepID=UPI0012ED76D7|nr:hypothetical protein [Methanobrevibacter cuticularis]